MSGDLTARDVIGDAPKINAAHLPLENPYILEEILVRCTIEDRGHLTPCWISDRSKNADGYTRIGRQGRTWMTHRWALKLILGELPEGLESDHLCRQRACARPSHLELVTTRVNVLRGEGISAVRYRQQQCIYGHEMTEVNTVILRGRRRCATCLTTERARRSPNPSPILRRKDGLCGKGLHDLTDLVNVYVSPRTGDRRCIPCRREDDRARYQAAKR